MSLVLCMNFCLCYRLLDMGYEKNVSQIISAIDSQESDIHRQTVLLSATLSDGMYM